MSSRRLAESGLPTRDWSPPIPTFLPCRAAAQAAAIPAGPAPHDDDFEVPRPVLRCIIFAGTGHFHDDLHALLAKGSCNLRIWLAPFTVTRHSMQTPIPHSGPRPSPCTNRRNRTIPAWAIATARTVPAATRIGVPLTWMVIGSDILQFFARKAGRIIRGGRDLRGSAEDHVGQETPSSQRRGNAEPLVAGCQPDPAAGRNGTDERQLVRSRRG